jgi:uncharacterized iron-regulated membrane protein
MTRRGIKGWYLVHKWTSLICTAFLLMLCVTGLPLIFEHELDHLLGYDAPLAAVAPGTPAPSLDAIVAEVSASRPGEVMQYLSFDEERPVVTAATAPAVDSPPEQVHLQPVDLRTGAFLPVRPLRIGVIDFFYTLHESMFAGLYGTFFLGAMGVLFLIAVISGVVVYAPFMRRQEFGTIRRGRSKRLRWLDIHNLAGIATTAWLVVVGATGVFNTLDAPLAAQWRSGQLAEMTAPYRNAPPLRHLGSVDAAVATARRAVPDMDLSLIMYPGTYFAPPHHYNVFMRGRTPVTAELLKPALVDAETATLTDSRDMPLHIRALFLSRPLHFGDYGGLPLKIVWALLDLVAILVLGSGVYLWLGRRGAALDRRVDELVTGGAIPEPAE